MIQAMDLIRKIDRVAALNGVQEFIDTTGTTGRVEREWMGEAGGIVRMGR